MLTRNSEFAMAQQNLFDRALFDVLQDDTVWQMVHDMGNIRGLVNFFDVFDNLAFSIGNDPVLQLRRLRKYVVKETVKQHPTLFLTA